ncbi:response regulator transcription factor, partial [Candidatus Arthromitus sp. SFB-rat-Yit]|uniref:response regulator transcription factor n=1 Tax=Candidatus Arthromitus sp. SFB-rat-Yit TaxID=1041504 RepID=UPI000227A466
MRIMIVDDERKLVNILKTYFEKEGFDVIYSFNGEDAIDKFYSNKIDLVILDWMIPGLSGNEVCRYIDEYIKKPFDIRFLIMRVNKLLNFDKDISFKDIRINIRDKVVYKNDKNLNLTKLEFDLLSYFIRNKGVILSRDRIIN